MVEQVGSSRKTRFRDTHVSARRSPATVPRGKQTERASTTHAHTRPPCTHSHTRTIPSARILVLYKNRRRVIADQSELRTIATYLHPIGQDFIAGLHTVQLAIN